MIHEVRLSGQARRQLQSAAAWYAAQEPRQVARLIRRFDEAKTRIADRPSLGRPVEGGLRRIALRVFPYHVWYLVEGEKTTIVAVTHFRQDSAAIVRASLGEDADKEMGLPANWRDEALWS